MELAVLILTRHRLRLLKKCLESIKAQANHPFRPKFYLLINGEDRETEEYLRSAGYTYWINPKPCPVGEARNKLIEKIETQYICFLDDDIVLPDGYFEKAFQFIQRNPNIDIFGGPDQNPGESSNFQQCLSLVMESYLANGPSNKRHKVDASGQEEGDEVNLILCNFWAKKKVFDIQMFPLHFRRNEENYLLGVLKDKGVSMRRVPNLFVYHNRKVSVLKLARVLFLAGVYRIVTIINYPKSARPIFFLHQFLVIFWLWWLFQGPQVAAGLFVVYIAVIAAPSMRIAWTTRRFLNFPLSMLLFMVFNFVYPAGQFCGYFKGLSFLVRGKEV